MNILVIEDDVQVKLMLRMALEKKGFTVFEAGDGIQGLDLVERQPIDLVITDIFMPNEDGMIAISRLKKDWPQIKILAISGGAPGGSFDFLPVAQALGADEILHKPFSTEELFACLTRLLPPPA
ncbi:MAG: response regulator [Candidatus Ozemobacter sibiricus]|uniref:Response regulator n=1 Tax=Candidatus Ozemobacter sibiricus TaxID=2268124 RepID=A0A367ZTA6_9BACT|nr:MAG: response regulator [Candidatus Ozemobacter sibiricus]